MNLGDGLTEMFVALPDGRHLRAVVGGGGDGPLVVFESGMGAPAATWLPVQRAVSEHARTLAYDRAGYGTSDVDPHDRTLERMADDLAALLDAYANSAPLVLVAHSWGGPIIRSFSRRHPERVAGIVFVEGTLAEVVSPAEERLETVVLHVSSLLVRLGAASLIKRVMLPHGASPEVSKEDMDMLWRDYASAQAMRTRTREAKHVQEALPLLRELQREGTPDVPTLALQGGRQGCGAAIRELRCTFTETTRALMDAQPQGKMIVVKDAGHLIPQEQPVAVYRAIVEVLTRGGFPQGASTKS